MLALGEPMVLAYSVEHQIEAAPFDATSFYLHAQYRMLDQLVEQIFLRFPEHDVLWFPPVGAVFATPGAGRSHRHSDKVVNWVNT